MVAFLALFGGMSGGMTIHQAAATSLFTFLFTGLLGTWLYQRRRSIDWGIAVPVCAGAVLGYLGAGAAALVDPRPLSIIIAIIIVAAGVYVLVPLKSTARHRDGRGGSGEQILLSVVGGVSGFGSGFSGAGGPLFSVPLMVILGYAPLAAVATSQVLQIIAASSGSLGNLHHGFIDWHTAALITVFELAGLVVGVRLAHVASPLVLRRLAAALCVISGGLLLWRSL